MVLLGASALGDMVPSTIKMPLDTALQDLVYPRRPFANPVVEFLSRTELAKTCEIRTQQNLGHCFPVTCAHINEKLGAFVTANESGEIIVWDLATQKVLSRISSAGGIVAVELCDQGVIAALDGTPKHGTGSQLKLFEALTGKLLHSESLHSLAPLRGASSGICITENLFCEVDRRYDKNHQDLFTTRTISLRRLVSDKTEASQLPVNL